MRVLKVVVGTVRSIGRSKRIKEATRTVSKRWGKWEGGSAVFMMSLFDRSGTGGKWKFNFPPIPTSRLKDSKLLS